MSDFKLDILKPQPQAMNKNNSKEQPWKLTNAYSSTLITLWLYSEQHSSGVNYDHSPVYFRVKGLYTPGDTFEYNDIIYDRVLIHDSLKGSRITRDIHISLGD